MNKIVTLVLASCAFAPAAWSETTVGVSIGIRQPGVYGRIDIGNAPPPRVVVPQPVVIVQSPVAVYQRPIYMYVPPGHQKSWDKYCGRYAACGQPVYFVQENWVRERYDHRHDDGRNRHDDRWDRGDRYDHGHSKGNKGRDDHRRN
ncbi:MAG: hypothetical protein U5M53_03605 [Rhodoferax sp.]|nr:hypothetical protein [Rhodoferax sp.]